MSQYYNDHQKWERDRDDTNNQARNMDHQWRRWVARKENAHVTSVLRLVNLREAGQVIWSRECSADTSSRVSARYRFGS